MRKGKLTHRYAHRAESPRSRPVLAVTVALLLLGGCVHREGSLGAIANAKEAQACGRGTLEVSQSISITGNDAMRDLDGLQGVTSLQQLYITHNPSLQSLRGLDSLSSVENTVSIERNSTLPQAEVDMLIRALGR